MPYTLRPARPSDAQTLADFNTAMAWETEHLRLDPPTVLAGVRAALADPAKGLYFVATDSRDHVVSQLLITHEWSDWRNGDLWWIQSVYTHPDHRRKGLFRQLYAYVRDQAQKANARGLRLYVEHENTPGQSTYHSLGMQMTHYRIMEEML
jgi:GNAT superfamily N-acetyltransferase